MLKNKRVQVSISITIMAALIAICIVILRLLLIECFHMSEIAATTVMTIGQVVAGSIGAIMIIIQLSRESDAQESQASIQEAQFILQYNQAFIQDSNMTYVEQLLETSMKNHYESEIITDENRQYFINYLVYLEGIAPLVLNNILRLEHIDDLMAYRFFLAVNNREVQEKELMYFPDFYKGCFKLYAVWKNYRDSHGYEILQEKQSLDLWLQYENYIDSAYKIRKANVDDLRDIAEILYGTDPYIYPSAFGDANTARKRFPMIMRIDGSAFNFSNINAAVDAKGRIIGAICYYDGTVSRDIDYSTVFDSNSETLQHVCKHYFNHLAEYVDSPDTVYIVAISVSEAYRGKKIGTMLLKSVLLEHSKEKIKLDVLCDNEKAINLYDKYGFQKIGRNKGYAYISEKRPDCFTMVRQPTERWIRKKFSEEETNAVI